MTGLLGYLRSLFQPDMMVTGLKVSAVVGTALFAINHGSALMHRKMDRGRWISAGLTYLVPYLVSVHGQYIGKEKNQTGIDG
ncbi:MAG: nitrate/nitrite transporter NrtS [Cyanobacteria bacterium P01_F01_bin.4]